MAQRVPTIDSSGALTGATLRWLEALLSGSAGWVKGVLSSTTNLDALVEPGEYPVRAAANAVAMDLPRGGLGVVTVSAVGPSWTRQTWTVHGSKGAQFMRERTGDTWSAWTAVRGPIGVRVDDYGARPNMSLDSAPGILAAINAAGGAPVYFTAGATYRVQSQLLVEGLDVDLRTDGAEPAVIWHEGQDFNPIHIRGRKGVASTELTGSIGIHSTYWKVASTAGIAPGMLVTVVSSKDWYHDARATAKKSELHRVAAITNGYVVTEAPAFDGYDLTKETVTLTFHDPVRVRMQNLTVRLNRPAVSDTAPERGGIIVEHATDPQLLNLRTENAFALGISLRETYNAYVADAVTLNSSGYSTGYGLQTAGTSYTTVERLYAAGCRRGVDVSGAVVVSRRTRVTDCMNVGGGTDSRGRPYGYTPTNGWSTTAGYGFGSHGPADDTVYTGCTSIGMYSHYTLRGRNERVVNPIMIGRGNYAAIVASHGSNLRVSGATSVPGWDGGGQDGTNHQSTSNPNPLNYFPDALVYIGGQYDGKLEGRIVVEDCQADVEQALIAFPNDESVCHNVELRNNTVRFRGDLPGVLAENQGTTVVNRPGWVVDGNVMPATASLAKNITFPTLLTGDAALTAAKAYTDTKTAAVTPWSTGWRSLPMQAGVTGTLLARRTGDQVWLRLVNAVPPAGSYAVHIALLPASLAPDGEWFFIAHDEGAGSPPSVYGMASGNSLTWQRTTTNVATRPTTPQSGSIIYSTKAAFPDPTNYPGSAA